MKKPVGIIAAQSIGERQTQLSLSKFHKAGMKDSNGSVVHRMQEILLASKITHHPVSYVYSNKSKIVPQILLVDAVRKKHKIVHRSNETIIVCFRLKKTTETVDLTFHPGSFVGSTLQSQINTALLTTVHTGTPGALSVERAECPLGTGREVTRIEGRVDCLDERNSFSSDIWKMFSRYGIEAVRLWIGVELRSLLPGVLGKHIDLIASCITFSGKPESIKKHHGGVLQRATQHGALAVFADAAQRQYTERITDVTSCIFTGQPIIWRDK